MMYFMYACYIVLIFRRQAKPSEEILSKDLALDSKDFVISIIYLTLRINSYTITVEWLF